MIKYLISLIEHLISIHQSINQIDVKVTFRYLDVLLHWQSYWVYIVELPTTIIESMFKLIESDLEKTG
jgi:hypothetical protein